MLPNPRALSGAAKSRPKPMIGVGVVEGVCAPHPWALLVTHPEHCGVNDERELEPEVGEARAVAHLLRVPAGHPGHSRCRAPGIPG